MVKTTRGLKHWADLSLVERAERIGSYPARNYAEYDAEIVARFNAGLSLSLDGKRRARKLLKETASANRS